MPAPETDILQVIKDRCQQPGYRSKLTEAASFGGVNGFMTNFIHRRQELAHDRSKSGLSKNSKKSTGNSLMGSMPNLPNLESFEFRNNSQVQT